MEKRKTLSEVVLGCAYLFMGLGMFYKTTEFESIVTKLCIAVIGIILSGGGIKKLHNNLFKNGDA